MRLDFNILWVEDQPDYVKAQIDKIGQLMQEEGFHCNPTLCGSMDDVRKVISTDVFADEIDLVLVDWDLGSNLHGEDAIEVIREEVRYKDVVFYSGQTVPEDLRRKVFDRGLEGVYCANREQLVDEVIGVFESLIKKVVDLDHTRGIVMGATSDIDYMVNECLTSIHGLADAAGKKKLLDDGREFIDTKIRELTELAEQMRKATSLPELFDAHLVFTAYDRLRLLARALNDKSMEAHRGYRKPVTTYQNDVVPKRNILGHVKRELKDGVYVLLDKKGNVFDLNTTRDLRRVILTLRADFRDLLGDLGAVGAEPARKK